MPVATSHQLVPGRLASNAMRYDDVAKCNKMAAHYAEFLERTGAMEPDYHSFIEYPLPGQGGEPRERLVVYKPHYKEEIIEFYEVEKADYPAVIERLNGTVVEDLVKDPDYHNGRKPGFRTVVKTSTGQRIGVIINPPVPFIGHSRKSGSARYLVPLAALAVGLAFPLVLKALRKRSKMSGRR